MNTAGIFTSDSKKVRNLDGQNNSIFKIETRYSYIHLLHKSM